MNSCIRITLIFLLTVWVAQSEGKLELDNEPELIAAQRESFNRNSQNGWVLLNYVGQYTVHLAAQGDGTTSEIISHLQDDQIQYGLVRLLKGIEIQDIFFVWIGPNVGIIERAKKLVCLGDAKAYLQPYQASISVLNRANFNYQKLLEASHPLSGTQEIN